jgi:subtilisin family serine protease
VRLRLAALLPLVLALLALGPGTPAGGATSASGKLRGDLALLVSGDMQLNAAIPPLVPGYVPGEIPFFAVLTEPNDAAHTAAIEALGARVLRTYKSISAYALAAQPAAVLDVAALPWVSWLAPVELVRKLDEHEIDQTRGTPADVGATGLWDAGVTGSSVKIAVLDTGLDAAHPDLDDLDFRNWSTGGPPKVGAARSFLGGVCAPGDTQDGNGHGTHVAGIATGTGEGTPAPDDNGKYMGVAPGARLYVGKVVTDGGVGLNSDLAAAMEAMAMPEDDANCQFGVDVVNISLGTESRPTRLNTGNDTDFVSIMANRLAVKYGTLFVAAVGNSGPFIGSDLEAPGSAAQALSVTATAKDYDVNHDDTLSGDTCASWTHVNTLPPPLDSGCGATPSSQPTSLSAFPSHGPSGDDWLRPDVAAPGYNIVSAQSSTGSEIAANDLNPNTKDDPLYATATGTSMAAPATAGAAALLLDAYRAAHRGQSPSGKSGVSGVTAPKYALLRAALMNTATTDLYEANWILTTDAGSLIADTVRNSGNDPYVGPLGEGAGKIDLPRAVQALRDGVVVYSAADPKNAEPGTGPRELQGTWQVGAIKAGAKEVQRFVLHSAPGIGTQQVSFSFDPGHPSDTSRSIPLPPSLDGWTVTLPGDTTLSKRNTVVRFTLRVPAAAAPGYYTGTVLAQVQGGQTLHIPVFAVVALHDSDLTAGNPPTAQSQIVSDHDVFAKDDTTWPSVVGTPGTGANADWLVYPVELAAGLDHATFSVYDSAAGDETYDVYVYDSSFDLVGSTHPFASPGVTDKQANDARGPSTEENPDVFTLQSPAAGRYYLVVNRAKIGGTNSGDFGSFVLTLDEVAP